MVTRRRFLKSTGATSLALIAYAAGCAPSGVPGGTTARSGRALSNELIVGQIGEPVTFNVIQRSLEVASTEVMEQIYNGLVRYNYATAKIEPELAESWSLKSPTVWEFKLREGVQFHKEYGEFTAQDVAFNINYSIEQKKLRANRLRLIKAVRATGKYTVEYELTSPFASFLISTARTTPGQMVSERAYKEIGESAFGRNPIATGPFQLESWKPGEVVLTRHKKYFKAGLPKLEKITFIPVTDPFVRRQKVEAGEIDLIGQPDYKDLEALRKNTNVKVEGVASTGWDYLQFNLKDRFKGAPWAKQEVRQAVAYALNREAIVKNVYLGEATLTDSPLPPGYLGYAKGPIKYPFKGDIERARALMSQAGHSSGFTINCITSDKPNLRRELEVVADQLKQINIRVDITNLDSTTFNDRWLTKTDYEMNLEDITLNSPDSHDAFNNFVYSKGVVNHGWGSAEIDKLIDESLALVNDEGTRAKNYERVARLTTEGAGWVFIAIQNVYRVMRAGLTGYSASPYESELVLEPVSWA